MKFTILIGLAAMLVFGGCANSSSSSDGGTTDTDSDTDTRIISVMTGRE